MGLNAGSVILASTELEREENNNRRELRFNVDCAISGIRGFATLSMKSYRTKFTVNRLALNMLGLVRFEKSNISSNQA